MGNKTLIGFFLVVLTIYSCKKDGGVCISSTGNYAQENRGLEHFREIDVSGNTKIEVYPNQAENRVEVIGGKHLLKGIETKVENNKLIINNLNRCNWLRSFKSTITVKIYTTDLNLITYRGSGDIVFMDTLLTDVFTLDSWDGSGDLTFLLNCRENYIHLHTGTTNVTLYGRTDFTYYYSLTTGFIYGQGMACKRAFLAQRGYGDMYINPTEHLDAEIYKSGNIYSPGNISINFKQYGSGQLYTF